MESPDFVEFELVWRQKFDGGSNSVAFSPDGTTLAVASSGGAYLWNVARGVPIELLHSVAVSSVAFSPDGKRLVCGCLDDGVQLWNLVFDDEHLQWVGARSVADRRDEPQVIASDLYDSLKPFWPPGTRNTGGEVMNVAFSSDNRTIGIYTTGSTDYLVETGARSSPPQWK